MVLNDFVKSVQKQPWIGVIKNFHRCFPMNIAKFLRTAIFYRKPLVAAFFCFFFFFLLFCICWPSLLNQKHSVGWLLLKSLQICSEYVILLEEPIPIHFCWLTCRKQNLAPRKTLQQGLFVLISHFWQFRHSNFGWDISNLKKIYASSRKLTWKIDNIKSPFRGLF